MSCPSTLRALSPEFEKETCSENPNFIRIYFLSPPADSVRAVVVGTVIGTPASGDFVVIGRRAGQRRSVSATDVPAIADGPTPRWSGKSDRRPQIASVTVRVSHS